MHPALHRLLRDCIPPVGQVRAMVGNEMVMKAKDAAAVKIAVQKELAHHLARLIIEDGRGTFTEETRCEYDAVEHRLVLHALSQQELDTLVIAAFEAGRKAERGEVQHRHATKSAWPSEPFVK
jgi:hypothetical protein